MEEIKIMLIGFDIDAMMTIAETLNSIDDNLSIAKSFTNDPDANDIHKYYVNNQEIELICKNSAYLTLLKKDSYTYGISMDEFYNSSIFVLDIDEFNNISASILSNNNILVVWFDSKYSNKENMSDKINSVKFLLDQLNYTNYVYMLDEDNEVVIKIINSYINGSDDKRQAILNEYV